MPVPPGIVIPEQSESERRGNATPPNCTRRSADPQVVSVPASDLPCPCTAGAAVEDGSRLRSSVPCIEERRRLRGTEAVDALVGCSGFHRVDWSVPKVEIGYWVRTPHSGQGYVTEAVNAITEFAVKHFGAKRAETRMDDRNERSWRVAERCGFTLEGILRHERRRVADGSLGDTRVYAKTFGDE